MSVLGIWLATTVFAGVAGSSEAGTPTIGTPITGFELTDDRGDVHRLSDWQGSRLVTVIVLGAGCPVAELYATMLSGLADQYQPRGVAFLGIAPNGRDTPSALARFASSHGLRFPIFPDLGGEVAARLGATRTPQVVVLDDRRRIRYRGRIDDQYAVGSRRGEARRHDLAEALDDLLAGRPVRRPETEAAGCPIDDRTRAPMPAELTYCRDIAPILQRRCTGCHRPGQVAPFALTTYRQAAGWAAAIAEAVEDGRMPPWHADPRYGRFANDARLTDHERQRIVDWARGGTPEGDPAELPPPAAFPGGWRIPEPDRVITMPQPFLVPAQGVVDYQDFEVDPGFRKDTWIRGAEIRPGNRKVVHHCNVFLKAPGSRNEVDAQGDLGSYCLAATTPGAPPMLLPDGMAKRVPAGWHLVFVVHYSPIGTVQTDQTSIGLLFADPDSVKKEVATNLMFDPSLCIPPHAADHRVEHSRRFDDDVLLLAMFPHMHLRGRSFRYEAIYPDGRGEILLDVPRYDFNWQNRYELAEPKRLPAGTLLRCTAHYDNSRDNPANPDPDATVRTGRQSWDEMFNGYYDIVLADQDLTSPWWRGKALLKAAMSSDTALILVCAACAISWLILRWNKDRRARTGRLPTLLDIKNICNRRRLSSPQRS
ncbi:MAG TPA: redoxin domain-containing protein [Isosphaeraceae bacterium]|nr:redoxin domain-containing protein [Isosphaeraceae bacterium]